jgi:proteasome lid subunit RPN8/RPN11
VTLVKEMENFDRESAVILHLDTKNQVMGIETISIGSLSASIVHPRETVKGAILNNSANVIFIHNHPSGVCGPSNEDIEITGRLKEAFELVGITLLDSIIVGKGCYHSLRETGFISGKMETRVRTVTEPRSLVSERIFDKISKEERLKIAGAIAATVPGTPQEPGKTYRWNEISRLPKEERLMIARGLTATVGEVKDPAITQETVAKIEFITAITEYITAPDLERRKRAAENIQVSNYFKLWFGGLFYVHDRECAKRKLMKFFAANEQGLGLLNHTYYSVLTEYLNAISKPVAELTVRESTGAEEGLTLVKKGLEDDIYEYIKNKPDVDSDDIASHFKLRVDITLNALAQLVKDRKVERNWLGFRYGYIPLTEQKSPSTVSENIPNNRELRKSFEKTLDSKDVNSIEAFLNRLTVDTSRYSRAVPLPESLVIGAAIAVDGFLYADHVTDDPRGVMQKLKSNIKLCQFNPEGDLGCGLYVSGVPQYWRGRSTGKWEFAKQLNRAQRQSLVNVILSDPRYRKGGGYLTDFEVGYLNRDLKQFVETGDVNLLAGTGNQPYNVHITKEIARKAGVPEPKEPGFIKVKLQGKFINAAGLYSNAEIVNRAQAWAVVNRPKLLQYNKRASTQNIVNAWLCSMGYCGAFTKSGMSTNPEMVIWGRKAIIGQYYPNLKDGGMLSPYTDSGL